MDFSEDDECRALRETVRAWTRRPMVESTPDTLERDACNLARQLETRDR